MPITVTAPEGLFTAQGRRDVLPKLTHALLDVHGLTGNRFMTPIIVGSVHVLPKEDVYAGARAEPVVFVELKVPAFTFPTQEIKQAFVRSAVAIVRDATGPARPAHRTFVNVVYAVDGVWGIDERAYTNAELGAEASRAATTAVA